MSEARGVSAAAVGGCVRQMVDDVRPTVEEGLFGPDWAAGDNCLMQTVAVTFQVCICTPGVIGD
jgi:hypothetical protein